jgi:hypothetical protein
LLSALFLLQNGDIEKTLDSCSEAINLDENNVDALCDRAEGYILNDMYQEGIVVYVYFRTTCPVAPYINQRVHFVASNIARLPQSL